MRHAHLFPERRRLRGVIVVAAVDFPIALGERSVDQVARKVEEPDMRRPGGEDEEHGLFPGADIRELRLLDTGE